MLKANKNNFFLKLIKTKTNHNILGAMVIVLPKVVEARERVRNEHFHQDAIKRNIKPKLQQITFGTLFTEIVKQAEFWWAFAWKLPKCAVQKHVSSLDGAMVTKGGLRRLKDNFVLWKLVKLSERLKSVAQADIDIFEEVYLGRGVQCAPPPPPQQH